MRSCALAFVGLGRLAAAVKLADLNWHSADLVNAAFVESACMEYEEDCPVSVGPQEFTSSTLALQSLADGQVDFFLECWDNCSLQGLHVEPLGFNGTYGLYVPTWLLELEPSLGGVEAWQAAVPLRRGERQLSVVLGHEVEVLGFPVTWSAAIQNLRDFYGRTGLGVLNSSLQFFDSPEAFDSRILSNLKSRKPMIFMYWEPSTLIGEPLYKVTRLQLPASWQSSFPDVQISKVRRSNHAQLDFLAYFDSFHVSSTDISGLLRSVVRRVSPAVPSRAATYAAAVQEVAALRECERTGRRCSAVGRTWPRLKDPSLPDKLVVLVKDCPGFMNIDTALLTGAGACNATSEANLRPSGLEPFREIDGYTVRHLLQTAVMLGYSQHDIIFHCTETTGGLVQQVAMDLADMGGACVTMTPERVNLVDFSLPMYTTSYGFMTMQRNTYLKFWGFFSPFTPETWVAIIGLLVLTAVVMHGLENPSHYVNVCRPRQQRELDADGNALSVLDPVLDMASYVKQALACGSARQDDLRKDDVAIVRTASGSVLEGRVEALDRDAIRVGGRRVGRQKASFKVLSRGLRALAEFGKTVGKVGTMAVGRDAATESFRQTASRGAANMMVLSGTLLLALYTASLASYLSQKPKGEIDSVAKLAGRKVGVPEVTCMEQCGARRCKSGPAWGLRRNSVEVYVDDVMNSGNQQRICLHPDDLVEALEKKYVDAIVGDMGRLQVDAKLANEKLDSCSVQVKAALAQDYGYTFPKGSLLAEPISQAALQVSLNTNAREQLDSKFFGLWKGCKSSQDSLEGLTPSDVGGLFVSHGIILACLIVYAAWERAASRRKSARLSSGAAAAAAQAAQAAQDGSETALVAV